MNHPLPSVRHEQRRVVELLNSLPYPLSPGDIAERLNKTAATGEAYLRPIDIEATIAALLLRQDLRNLLTITVRRASRTERRTRQRLNFGSLSGVVVLTACSTFQAPAPVPPPPMPTYFDTGAAPKDEPGPLFHPFSQVTPMPDCSSVPCLGNELSEDRFAQKTTSDVPASLIAYFADDSDRIYPQRQEAIVVETTQDLIRAIKPSPPAMAPSFAKALSTSVEPPITLSSLLAVETPTKFYALAIPAASVPKNLTIAPAPVLASPKLSVSRAAPEPQPQAAQPPIAETFPSTPAQEPLTVTQREESPKAIEEAQQPASSLQPVPASHGDVKRLELRLTYQLGSEPKTPPPTFAAPMVMTRTSTSPIDRIKIDAGVLRSSSELVSFPNDSDILDAESRAQLQSLAKSAESAQSIRLRGRVGYRVLNDDYRQLAVGRAIAVRRALVELGVPQAKIRILFPRNNDFVNAADPSDPVNRSVSIEIRSSSLNTADASSRAGASVPHGSSI